MKGSIQFLSLLTIGISVAAFSETDVRHTLRTNENNPNEFHSETNETDKNSLTINEVRVYLALIEDRKTQLQKANEALLSNVDYSYWKIGAFVGKAAVDGYCSGQLVKGFQGLSIPATVEGGAVVANQAQTWSREAVKKWLANGGLKKLKEVGFDVGLVGLSSAANHVLAEKSHWQYHIPIIGTAFAAYTWSENLMNTPELIEKNGKEIALLTKEKFRVLNFLNQMK
jgi:hypothetical protein